VLKGLYLGSRELEVLWGFFERVLERIQTLMRVEGRLSVSLVEKLVMIDK
jgi:hypothetical protein